MIYLPVLLKPFKKGKKYASAGNRTRINCLEGSYADHYTTDALVLRKVQKYFYKPLYPKHKGIGCRYTRNYLLYYILFNSTLVDNYDRRILFSMNLIAQFRLRDKKSHAFSEHYCVQQNSKHNFRIVVFEEYYIYYVLTTDTVTLKLGGKENKDLFATEATFSARLRKVLDLPFCL